MALLAIVPGCNFVYSAHGGPAWLILPLVFPLTLYQLFRIHRESLQEPKPIIRRFVFISLAAYFPISFAVSTVGALSLERFFGYMLKPIELWSFFVMPFGLIVNWKFFAL
jgi:hypothetical protein